MRCSFFILLLLTFQLDAQPLRDINYKYLYSSSETFSFDMKPVREQRAWVAFYSLEINDASMSPSDFTIIWEVRQTLSEKQGKSVVADSVVNDETIRGVRGKVVAETSLAIQYLVAKVVNTRYKQSWYFWKLLEPKYPVRGYLYQDGLPVSKQHINVNTRVDIENVEHPVVVSYYATPFPPAAPPFAEGLAKVSPALNVDSSFMIHRDSAFVPTKKGLYLVQRDTNAAEGFTFRVEDDYPRLAKVESLADPLIYVCTKQEFEKVKQAKGDKRAFDKVILSMTKDADRAKIFIRNYFKRVESANMLFTSYKEGWKTDRGMIYIIFGLPDEVFKLTDREVWNYKNTNIKVSFDFVRSPTLFDPENFVLLRSKKYQESYYQVIDLWRNARF